MEAARTRYELLVGTVVSKAALATFPVPLRRIAVPRHTVYRFVIPADRDLSDVLDRLTQRNLVVLEIRRRSDTGRRDRGTPPGGAEASGQDGPAVETGRGVVVPFASRQWRRRSGAGRSGGRSAR